MEIYLGRICRRELDPADPYFGSVGISLLRELHLNSSITDVAGTMPNTDDHARQVVNKSNSREIVIRSHKNNCNVPRSMWITSASLWTAIIQYHILQAK